MAVSIRALYAVFFALVAFGVYLVIDLNTKPPMAAPSAPIEPKRIPIEKTPAQEMFDIPELRKAAFWASRFFRDRLDEEDEGAILLAQWMGDKRTTVKDLKEKIDETSRALVMKDSVRERGRYFCTSGKVIQIQVVRGGITHTAGILMTPSWDPIRFVTTRSSGNIVDNTHARFCGIVSGRYSYSNTGGGVSHAVYLAGLFDIPENR